MTLKRFTIVVIGLTLVSGALSCRQSTPESAGSHLAPTQAQVAPGAESPEAEVDFEHGNRQVTQMLADRPAMAEFVTRENVRCKINSQADIWKWAAEAYGKKVNGGCIEWDDADLDKPSHYMADHTIPYQGKNGLIRVRERFEPRNGHARELTFEELWSSCIFELYNIQSADAFLDIYRRSLTGQISRDQWVRTNTQIEHNALLRLVTFYELEWKQWADENDFASDPAKWRCDTPKNYDEWINLYRTGSSNPYLYWENYYDKQIVPYLEQLGLSGKPELDTR